MKIKFIKDLNLNKEKVFIRCDFNVPMDEFSNINDDRRIRSALATIKYCLDRKCSIILASHLGRPKAKYEEKYSLKPIQKRLSHLLNQKIIMSKDVVGKDSKEKAKELKAGEILLLENLRFEEGESKNDEKFSKELASLSDIYINDAFGVCHRAHSSVDGMTKYFEKKAGGFLLQEEIAYLSTALKTPQRPYAAIIGGSKVSSKLGALVNILPKVDKIIIGGAMAFTFLKALGEDIGSSLVEDELVEDAKKIMKKAKKLGVKFYLPVDVIVAQDLDKYESIKSVPVQEIPKNYKGLDIGLASVKLFMQALSDCQTILWNGPMGVYEIEKFSRGSFKIANFISELYATTIIGGGDSADLVLRAGVDKEISFISTGGGASLELIEGKKLPGIECLKEDK